MKCPKAGSTSSTAGAAKRFLEVTVDWQEIMKRVSDDQKIKFLAFKGKSEGYLRRVQSYPEQPPKIDWEAYKTNIPDTALVDKMRKEYEAYKVPYPEDNITKSIDEQWREIQKEIQTFKAEREKEIKAAEKELKNLRALPKFEDMTMEMFKDIYPENALDPVYKPTYWPHNPEEQVDYVPPPVVYKKK